MLWEHLWHLRVIVSKELLDWTCFCFFQGLPTKDKSDWEENALALFGRTKIIKREVVTLIKHINLPSKKNLNHWALDLRNNVLYGYSNEARAFFFNQTLHLYQVVRQYYSKLHLTTATTDHTQGEE